MTPSTHPALRRLLASSVLYIVFALIATRIAVAENRVAEFGGSHTELTALESFLFGNGTALSPPLYWLLAQVVLTLLAPRQDRWGSVGVIGLALFGLLSVIGALGEPILLETFNPATFNLLKAVVQAGMILLPIAMLVFGILEWLRRRREKEAA